MFSLTSLTALRRRASNQAQDWFESPRESARLLPMEGLRGLAVLVVFFVHAHALFGPYIASYAGLFRVSEYLGRVGIAGVDLFFVLSGFIIYGALVHKQARYFTFLQRRVRRIYPTFLVVLSCYLVLSVLFPSESKIPTHTWSAAKYILENVLFLPGFFRIVPIITVAWSLSFEFAFYLSVPLVVFIFGDYRQDRVRRITLLSAMWVLFSLLEVFFFNGTHIRMLSFVSGMLLQEVTAGGQISSLLTRRGQWISVFAVVVTASYHFAFQSREFGLHTSGALSVMLMSAAIFAFALYTLEYPGVLRKVCTFSPVRYWGNISYSYYLAHGITLKALATLVERVRPERHPILMYFGVLAAGLVATWVSASVLYLLVEKPLSFTAKKQHARTQPARGAAFVVAAEESSRRRELRKSVTATGISTLQLLL